MKGKDVSVRRTLETLRRYCLLLLMLGVLCPVTCVAVTYLAVPKTYQATATLWALHKYSILTQTNLDPNDLSTPAETQVTALSELVQSRSFSLAVAQQANLAVTLKTQVRADPQSRDNALVADIGQHVKIQALGYSLLTITYTGPNPQVSQQVVGAVIKNYGQESQNIAAPEEKNLLGTYQHDLVVAESNEQRALATETQYIQANSKLTASNLQDDPRYQQLHAQTQLDELTVQNIQNNIGTLAQDIVTRSILAVNLYKVLDTPTVQPVSLLKSLLLGAGVGLAIAMVVCALLIALAMGSDRRVYTCGDLEKVTAYPVIMELPYLSPKTIPIFMTTSAHSDHLDGYGRT